jgi:hypothetical protein
MDTILFCVFQRACDHLSDDNQAVIDWADDTEFRLSVRRRDLKAAVARGHQAQSVLDKAKCGIAALKLDRVQAIRRIQAIHGLASDESVGVVNLGLCIRRSQ